MKIAVWRTGHEIADTVAEAVYVGLTKYEFHFVHLQPTTILHPESFDEFDLHIGYGILRGVDKVFSACGAFGKPWIHIDKGYWKPGHYNGYYRVSLCGTQQTKWLDKLEPDYPRWDKLGIEILPGREPEAWVRECRPIHMDEPRWQSLICPPTKPVRDFFHLGDTYLGPAEAKDYTGRPVIFREKNCVRSLQKDLDNVHHVATFNSSVGWEALRQGIPVTSDPTHSIVGAYEKLIDKPLHLDYDERRKLFAIQAGLQLSLDEIRSGFLWPLIQRLLSAT